MNTEKRKQLEQKYAEIIRILTEFFNKHNRGATRSEIRSATTNNPRTINIIKHLVNVGILKKNYYTHKPTGVVHSGYVPAGLEEELQQEKEQEAKKDFLNAMRLIWVVFVPWYRKIGYWWHKHIRKDIAKANEIYYNLVAKFQGGIKK